MRIGSLFAGIGGFDLAARWMGWTTVWVSEIDPYASAVLKKHFPDAPNLGDITQLNGHTAPPIDMLVGGFPCQDISVAGKGAGIEGARSGLWSHYARLIGETKPRWVVIENSPALRTRGFDRVLKDLAALGYDAEWHCIPAASVGAPHRRDRIWIIARPTEVRHTSSEGLPLRTAVAMGQPTEVTQSERSSGEVSDTQCRLVRIESGRSGREDRESQTLGYPVCERSTAGLAGSLSRKEGDTGEPFDAGSSSHVWGSFAGWWAVEPDMGRVAHGVPSRVDRVKCLGNAIVPQVAFEIFSAIARYEILSFDHRE